MNLKFGNSFITIFMLGFMSTFKMPMMGNVQYSNMLQKIFNNIFTQDDYNSFLGLKIKIKHYFLKPSMRYS